MDSRLGKSGSGSLVRDASGVPIHHVTMGWSLYADHALVRVLKSDPRGDGRPPRVLATLRVPVGFHDLVGLPSLDAALALSRALTAALARNDDTARAQPPAPPAGATGAAVDPLRTDSLPDL